VSPDGEWVIVHPPGPSDRPVVETLAIPIRGGVPRRVCRGDINPCTVSWSLDGKFFYVRDLTAAGRITVAIPLPAGKVFPDSSVDGITDLKRFAALPGARTIEEGLISPGSDPSIYVFTKEDSQRNLFRIPLH
jgi:hypothetical protein